MPADASQCLMRPVSWSPSGLHVSGRSVLSTKSWNIKALFKAAPFSTPTPATLLASGSFVLHLPSHRFLPFSPRRASDTWVDLGCPAIPAHHFSMSKCAPCMKGSLHCSVASFSLYSPLGKKRGWMAILLISLFPQPFAFYQFSKNLKYDSCKECLICLLSPCSRSVSAPAGHLCPAASPR